MLVAIELRGDLVPGGDEVAGDHLGLTVGRDRDGEVDIARKPWLGPNAHRQAADQGITEIELVEQRDDRVQ
jgi:hypothetical protein